jgi:hypothetical protein
MSGEPTPRQLEVAARDISYRAWQLTNIATGYQFRVGLEGVNPALREMVGIAMVESALVNARALARFFVGPSEVNFSMYVNHWHDDVIEIAKKIESPLSRHLGHASFGGEDGEPHHREWPVVELGLVLVPGLSNLVQAVERSPYAKGDAKWFQPSPEQMYRQFTMNHMFPTVSGWAENPSVAELARQLRAYLDARNGRRVAVLDEGAGVPLNDRWRPPHRR